MSGTAPGGDAARLQQVVRPADVSATLRDELVACWRDVTNAGGAVGFPTGAVEDAVVRPRVDAAVAALDPGTSRLFHTSDAEGLTGWVLLDRDPAPLVAHWGRVRRLQTHPRARGRGLARVLLDALRAAARDEMGLEQLYLTARSGMGLEDFYLRLGWEVVGRRPAALRVAPGDDRDEVHLRLAPL